MTALPVSVISANQPVMFPSLHPTNSVYACKNHATCYVAHAVRELFYLSCRQRIKPSANSQQGLLVAQSCCTVISSSCTVCMKPWSAPSCKSWRAGAMALTVRWVG